MKILFFLRYSICDLLACENDLEYNVPFLAAEIYIIFIYYYHKSQCALQVVTLFSIFSNLICGSVYCSFISVTWILSFL